jgi:hypothetical protein
MSRLSSYIEQHQSLISSPQKPSIFANIDQPKATSEQDTLDHIKLKLAAMGIQPDPADNNHTKELTNLLAKVTERLEKSSETKVRDLDDTIKRLETKLAEEKASCTTLRIQIAAISQQRETEMMQNDKLVAQILAKRHNNEPVDPIIGQIVDSYERKLALSYQTSPMDHTPSKSIFFPEDNAPTVSPFNSASCGCKARAKG